MTSSTSSSSRRAAVALLASALAGCAGAGAAGPMLEPTGPSARVLVLPPENLTGGSLPARELMEPIERALATRGVDVITGAQLEEWLARYRIRYTGGVDAVAAQAAREELGADGLLVTSIQVYDDAPRLALSMRLVASGPEPRIVWAESWGRTGADSPGLLGLGFVGSLEELRAEALGSLFASLGDRLEGRGPVARPCPGGAWFDPRIAYENPPDRRESTSVAVLPFVNYTRRRGAGELLALEFTGQVAAVPGVEAVEPGVVRDALLKRRIVMEDGVSLDQARTLTNALQADLVVAGYVFDFDDGGYVPVANFTVLVLDRKTNRIVWESTSWNKGTDSETVFGLNRVTTGHQLACRMARNAVVGFAPRGTLPPRR